MEKAQSSSGAKVYDVEKIASVIVKKALYVLAGYLSGLCVLPFGACPFGVALLAAADRNSLFAYLGLVLSCFVGFEFQTGILLIGVYSAVLLLRILVRLTLDYPYEKGSKQSINELARSFFCERAGYRVLVSAIGAVALGISLVAVGGFQYYDLWSLLIMSVSAPIAAYAFYCFFCRGGIFKEIGFLSLCAVCVYAALPIKIYGVSVAALIALWVTLMATRERGALKGIAVALLLGLIYSPALCVAFILASLCVAALSKLSMPLACFGAFFACVGWGFYVRGLKALDGFFAAVLCACVLYSVFYKLYFARKDRLSKTVQGAYTKCEVLGESELDGIRLSQMNRRMFAISDGLESLSGFFEEVKLRFPKRPELEEMCNNAFELSCGGCAEYEECRRKRNLDAEIKKLSALLLKNVSLCSKDVSPELMGVCSRLPDILDEINYNAGVRRSGDENEVFAPDYKALSRLLEKSVEGEEGEYSVDGELSEGLCAPLEALRLGICGVMVYGKRKRSVYVKAKERKKLEENLPLLLDTLNANLPFLIDADSVSVGKGEGDGGVLFVGEAERYRISFAQRVVKSKEEKEFCGDSLTLFKNNDNRFFALISDGMGSGREAAAVSEICTRFMGSMLGVGQMNSELLSMLNGFLRGRCEGNLCECSATFDMMELDLISGETEFFKSGAAPSYVYRDGSLFKLRSFTMPIGILEETDSKSVKFKLSEGDVVVMMSDGVTGGEDECPWLFDLLLQNVGSAGLERTADLILKYAIGHGSNDDISVAVIRVEGVA